MRHGGMTGSAGDIARRMRLLALAGAAAFVVLGLMAGPALASKSGTTWLCKPGSKITVHKGEETVREKDPCTESLTTTVVQTDGETSEEKSRIPKNTPVNCFYVYPTVSEQATENANLEIEDNETQVAIDQASRFSHDCNVYAPMYKQVTLTALNSGKPVTEAASVSAFLSVLGGFDEFIAKYDHGKPFVLIGHSQGSLMLEALISRVIESSPELSDLLVSAVLMGGNVLVPEGQLVGGTFQHVPACQSALQTGCVIAYSTFLKEPPEGAYFGRENSPLLGGENTGKEVVCVNPTLLTQNGNAGPLLPYASTTPFPGELGLFQQLPTGTTPWVSSPGEYTAQCHHENGANWLQVNPVGTAVDPDTYVEESLGPDWGLHLYDINIALGNLVKTVAIQEQSYLFAN
ncbi:MAG TPA: DUF3089 domain-containing protein [Solirubrobacteraceae bacterium]|nr:DUF3089 domain-containing protein [Solirubrobacteraceae bacterium]